MSADRSCPFCQGRGHKAERVSPKALGLAGADYERRTPCEPCSSTGDHETMKLVRAARLGEAVGMARAAHRLDGTELIAERDVATGELRMVPAVPMLGWDSIRVAVVDDLRRQRAEEMLTPGSRLQLQVENLLREREPLLASLASLASELRERVTAEIPA